MRKGFSVSATIEALQFLIPRTLCDELAVKGDDCPSWRISLVVKFNIWLNKTRRVPILKLLISIRNDRKQRKNIKPTIERRRTEQLLICFFCRLKIHLFVLLFLPRKFYCIRVARIKSPHRTNTGAGHVRTDGITTYFRFSTTTARERTVPGRAPPHTPLLELRTRT